MSIRHFPGIFCFGVLISCAVAIASYTLPQPPDKQKDLKAEFEELFQRMMSASEFAERDAAEWKLLKLGPEILPLMEKPEKAPSRLADVYTTLKELQPRKGTLDFKDKPLAEVLASLQKQTGLSLADRRQNRDDKPISLDLADATYWQMVDAVASKTNSRLSLYQADGHVALTDGPDPKLPVSLQGAFRVAVKRISTDRDFDAMTHTAKLGLEIAWEPRFAPYLIEIGNVSLHDNLTKDSAKAITIPGRGPMIVHERNAREFDVLFASPPRSATAIQNVKGKFIVTMPVKLLTFTLKPTAGDKLITEGVKVEVNKVTADKDRWSVELSVEVPAAGPSFASFQTWLGSKNWRDRCICQFERTIESTKEILRPNPLGWDIVGAPSATRVVIRYQFTPKKDSGQPGDWRLTFRVPGRMVEMTVPFSFDSIALP